MCVPCKSGSLARLIAWSSEFIQASAPMFVQSTLESVQGGCHDNVLGELIPQLLKLFALKFNLDLSLNSFLCVYGYKLPLRKVCF